MRAPDAEQARTMNPIVTKTQRPNSESNPNKKGQLQEVEKRKEKSKGQEEKRCSPIDEKHREIHIRMASIARDVRRV